MGWLRWFLREASIARDPYRTETFHLGVEGASEKVRDIMKDFVSKAKNSIYISLISEEHLRLYDSSLYSLLKNRDSCAGLSVKVLAYPVLGMEFDRRDINAQSSNHIERDFMVVDLNSVMQLKGDRVYINRNTLNIGRNLANMFQRLRDQEY